MLGAGMLISGRYEIIEKIGTGGMADVYKATDVRLNRLVAVKVLKQEYSNDKGFITRFKNEAQSAAGLSHPNIVSVYDVGDDSGYHYIVMELVEGITLKKFIEKKGRLEVREAVGIAIQIAQGMEAAHDNHIIHRDIKPQNIMISRDGKVKVADFGIAKAATKNTFQTTAVGTVHYLSPEQARGGFSDERGDIYSLGVTLYEMLTGTLPFGGNSDVTVALQHIQKEAKPARELVPSIPYSLDRVVQKCMQKHPENRYASASDLIIDLKHSITNPDGDFVWINNSSASNNNPTKTFTKDQVDEINSQSMYSNSYENDDKKVLAPEVEELDTVDSKWEKIIIIVSIVVMLVIIGVVVFIISKFAGLSIPGISGNKPTPTTIVQPSAEPTRATLSTVKIPSVVGFTPEDAENFIKAISKDLSITYTDEEYSTVDKGLVIKQYPAPETEVLPNITIRLTLSAGGEPKKVPRLIGLPKEAVEAQVAKEFNLSFVYELSAIVAAGQVIRTEPEFGDTILEGDTITVYISAGAEYTVAIVPSLVGRNLESVTQEVEAEGLKLNVTYDYSNSFDKDLIVSQSIEAKKTVTKDTTIDIVISLGPYPENYIPTPTPSPSPTPSITTGRKYFSVEVDTTKMPNPVEDGSSQWLAFEIYQDNYTYSIDANPLDPTETEIEVGQSEFARKFVFRLYLDDANYATLHEGEARVAIYAGRYRIGEESVVLSEKIE